MKHSKISKAKARLLLEHPFFATLLIRTEVKVIEDFPALAATDGEHMYFNAQFLESLTIEDTMAVMCHEVGHDSLLHSIRLGARNADVWNQACDHAINLMLEDQKFKCPKSVPGGWLADPKYKGMSADRIYDDLRRNPPPPAGGGGGGKGDPSAGQQGKGKPGAPQPGKDWLHGDVLPSKAQTPDEQAIAEQRAKQKVASAANMARMAGKLNGELARMVDECLDAKVSWVDLLRDYLLRVVKAKDNWSRRNRRFDKVYLPTRRSVTAGPLCFIIDTSGSMNEEDLQKVCSEIAHCAAQTEPESIRVVWADARVAGVQEFTPDEFSYAALKPKGGGGTDMRVALSFVEQYEPQVVILMTDLYSPWPAQAPSFPLITIASTNHTHPDWMHVVRI